VHQQRIINIADIVGDLIDRPLRG